MIRQKGRLRRQLVVLGSIFGSAGEHTRVVAWRCDQAADGAAGDLPVCDRASAGARRGSRSAGAVHLLDLLTA